jgi:pimeloyl-ACP methyl ester carboxylesterase
VTSPPASTVVIAGHSGSCLVARRVAIDHDERVAGLVLEASPTTMRGNPDCDPLVVYTGVGHTPRWEDPTRFAADVAAFVARIPS